jgi:2,3-bisphosphoglycerate-independent phosphoglycerate mutase
MKQIIFLGDGMADRPVPELGGRTPLDVADIPHMDRLAQQGFAGMVTTIPAGMPTGSDTANMAVMGFDPRLYYTGRSPLEAIGMAVEMERGDVSFRCNLVTLSDAPAYDERTMVDYSADEIGSDEAARLIEVLNEHFASGDLRFFPGKSYRHCLIWKGGPTGTTLVPPHDILTRRIGEYLPVGPGAERILGMMRQSGDFLPCHPVNKARCQRDVKPANAIWIWGEGVKPELPNLTQQYNLRGSVITAVDLIIGLGICAGLHVVEVQGATGNIHTNFDGKAEAAIAEFARGQDYIYLHVEAPDECGHRAEVANKVRAIELIDHKVIGPVWDYLEHHRQATGEDYRILVMPDHPTPLTLRTHVPDPVPFACFSSDGRDRLPAAAYTEAACQATGFHQPEGYRLFGQFVGKGFI